MRKKGLLINLGLIYSLLFCMAFACNDSNENRVPPDETPVPNNVAGTCSFDAPPGPASDNSAPSAQLFKRVIYERMTAAEKARFGLQFTTFQMGTPFKNVMTGKGLLKSFVPENAMIYPVKTQYTTCRESILDYNDRRITQENFGCYKNNFGEWMCGTDGVPELLETREIPKNQ